MTRALLAEMEPTWPPARQWRQGPWVLRDGAGGGGRVSAATLEGPYDGAPPPFVMVREGEEALDRALVAAGYGQEDEVTLYLAPVADLAAPAAVRAEWPPGPDAVAMWAASGRITAPRLAVMARCGCPRTIIACEGGAVFAAVNGDLAVLHALEVAPQQRRRGLARRLVQGAAQWAADRGAARLGLVVSADNAPARALYAALGMAEVGRYHYRRAPR
ncbi:GNAT family N-acetyltransferase [Falsirhodobacter algicola]|uniref:GNAT family N-acetyltransferase n=1 Tax=Falsirhodobacter algicola TaxID=2692330 RepID=A0A8J8MU38_9RHOB|nr:GNAT family N-acetyltransferase [Falsirhodobacter algicola]QUS36504.1 GNAT family N-acetyltransferase [Falsirhodobacter algicola]